MGNPQAVAAQAVAIDSPIGALTLIALGDGLQQIRFGTHAPAAPARHPVLRETQRQLKAYFAGKLTRFELPLDLDGTPFQRGVWKALLRIPYGKTRSYAEIARAVGHPRAFRAVGGANRRNPIPIVVPCHRVIGSSGALTGYSGKTGLGIKAALLDLERRHL